MVRSGPSFARRRPVMRKARVAALFVVLTLATTRAQEHGRFDVSRFGAVGDGKAIDTEAINKAIDAAKAAGGGTVVFHHGTYLAGSIHLQSPVALFMDHGAPIESAPSTSPTDAATAATAGTLV